MFLFSLRGFLGKGERGTSRPRPWLGFASLHIDSLAASHLQLHYFWHLLASSRISSHPLHYCILASFMFVICPPCRSVLSLSSVVPSRRQFPWSVCLMSCHSFIPGLCQTYRSIASRRSYSEQPFFLQIVIHISHLQTDREYRTRAHRHAVSR